MVQLEVPGIAEDDIEVHVDGDTRWSCAGERRPRADAPRELPSHGAQLRVVLAHLPAHGGRGPRPGHRPLQGRPAPTRAAEAARPRRRGAAGRRPEGEGPRRPGPAWPPWRWASASLAGRRLAHRIDPRATAPRPPPSARGPPLGPRLQRHRPAGHAGRGQHLGPPGVPHRALSVLQRPVLPRVLRARPARSAMPHEERKTSLGSGVIVSPDGLIVTNNHVIEHARQIAITTADHRRFRGTLVGTRSRHRHRGGEGRGQGPPHPALGRLLAGRRRRIRGRHRQPVPAQPDRHHGHHQRHRPLERGHRRLRGLHPDRRRHQPRQLRRARSSTRAASSSASTPPSTPRPAATRASASPCPPTSRARSWTSSCPRAASCAAGSGITKHQRRQRGDGGGPRARGQQGVVIVELLRGSPADRAGVEPGDVVVEVDGRAVENAGPAPQRAGRARRSARTCASPCSAKGASVELARARGGGGARCLGRSSARSCARPTSSARPSSPRPSPCSARSASGWPASSCASTS